MVILDSVQSLCDVALSKIFVWHLWSGSYLNEVLATYPPSKVLAKYIPMRMQPHFQLVSVARWKLCYMQYWRAGRRAYGGKYDICSLQEWILRHVQWNSAQKGINFKSGTRRDKRDTTLLERTFIGEQKWVMTQISGAIRFILSLLCMH